MNACAVLHNMCHIYANMPEDKNPADSDEPEQSEHLANMQEATIRQMEQDAINRIVASMAVQQLQ